MRYVERFPATLRKNYRKMMLRRVVFPLVGRSRSLLALATRLRHDRSDCPSGSPGKASKLALATPGINMTFLIFFLKHIDSISTIIHHFLAPRPLKPLKSSPRYQNLYGILLRDHSDHQGPLSDPIYLKNDGLIIKISLKRSI